MKFVIAVVMLSLALGAQSSFLRAPYLAAPYTIITGTHLLPAPLRSVAVHASLHPVPVVATYPTHAINAYSPIALSAQADYKAKTRGSVHIAPLPGHINSVRAINLEPAPGTL